MSSIYHSPTIYNLFQEMKICKIFTQTIITHMMGIIIAIFSRGYKGKAVDIARHNARHRTTIAHFLNHGKWNGRELEEITESAVVRVIYVERWPIEVFFRQSKNILAFDKVQLRSAQGVRRFWLMMSLAHFICVTSSGSITSLFCTASFSLFVKIAFGITAYIFSGLCEVYLR